MELTVNYAGADEVSEHIKMLVAGPSGVGKDRFALTAPNPIWANCKAGLTTLAAAGAPYVNVTCEQDLLNLRAVLDGTPEEREQRFGFPVDTFVFSTVDEFQRLLLQEKLAADHKAEAGPGDWGWLGQRCNAIFESLSNLPVHVIFVTHTKQETDGDRFWLKPQLQGAFVDQIGQYTDVSVLMKATNYLNTPIDVDADTLTINGTVTNAFTFTSSDTADFSPQLVDDRYFVTRPTPECDWAKDYTNTLPPFFSLNFENDFDRILDLRQSMVVKDSHSVDLEVDIDVPTVGTTAKPAKLKPKATKPTAVPQVQEPIKVAAPIKPQHTNVPCSSCGNMVESTDWVELSQSRFDTELCKSCYTTKKATY